ncbi:PREDICTED: uncharacterized protein LOC104812836 [Tarenaya hassleriana]|uniref:uncharacterized protein LOC104812836 n=1 Tax=Tarenaya hassleriana TaxID=28532 RepID=UPI00053C8353|nr:PREDICTED: uncharacterized protein LOC104812836 [Tarenaya hassleriana]
MGFLKKLAGILGFGRDDGGHEVVKDEEEDGDSTGAGSGDGDKRRADNQPRFRETGLPRKGFGVPVQVAVERSNPGPVLLPCTAGDGGVQGLRWYSKRLRVDEDGDVADEFLEEILPEQWANREDHNNTTLRLELKNGARPAKVRGLMVSSDGKLQQYVEHQGRLILV